MKDDRVLSKNNAQVMRYYAIMVAAFATAVTLYGIFKGIKYLANYFFGAAF